jgi:hypothetical protein
MISAYWNIHGFSCSFLFFLFSGEKNKTTEQDEQEGIIRNREEGVLSCE